MSRFICNGGGDMKLWKWMIHASFSLFYVVMSKSVERVQNEHGSAVNSTAAHTATSRTAAAAATTAVVRSYCMRPEHKETLKSTYVLHSIIKKTCALPILAHMSHITISFASILFSYFYLSYTLQSTTHIRRQMLRWM